MTDTQGLTALGGIVLVIGIIGLLIGLAMPETSTHTSETCVDSFTGYGQNCVTGSVTTANPLRAPAIGVGMLGIFSGIGILIIGRNSSLIETNQEIQNNEQGEFAEKLRDYQENSDNTWNDNDRNE